MKKKGKIILEFEGSEVIEKTASKFGTGAHVVLPKKYAGKKVKVVVEDVDE